MKNVKVALENRSYQIKIGSGSLDLLAKEIKNIGLKGKILIVTNTTVEPLYEPLISGELKNQGYAVQTIVLPDGENYKSLEIAARIYDSAIEFGLDRQGTILALGGGVIGDMAGFAAATYMRGINFVQVPTTLLAQVDASVGGKVAVNHPRGKNIIGAFYQPKLVFIDVDTLQTLELREIRSGFAEIIKYGVISDPDFFTFMEKHPLPDHIQDNEYWEEMIEKSCSLKSQVVSEDELEHGIRANLNFGHTIGHGLEAATSYQAYRHGEAVAIGMVGASFIAKELGLLKPHEAEKIKRLILKSDLPVNFSEIPWSELWFHIQADKKAQDGNINFILPTSIGSVVISPVDPLIIRKVVEQELMK